MPDDPLFPTGTTDPPTPVKPNGDPPKDPPAGDRPMTVTDVTNIVKELVEPNTEQMGRITQNQSELAETLKGMQGALERLGVAPEGTRASGDEPALDAASFLSQPEEAIEAVAEKVVGRVVKEQVAPILSMQVEQTHDQTVAGLRREIDTEYGEGTWEKEFKPELDPLFRKAREEAPSRLGDAAAIRRTVDAVKGMKFDLLMGLKKTENERREQEMEDERQRNVERVTSNLPAGLTRTTSGEALPPEAKDFLAKIYDATGEQVDEREFLTAMNSGSTLKEYQAAMAKLEKK